MWQTLIAIAVLGANPDLQVVRADRASIPQPEWGYYTYFHTSSVSAEDRVPLENAFKFTCASLSHKTDLSKQLPRQVSETVWRIDTRGPGWEKVLWKQLIKFYPFYRHNERRDCPPALVDCLWFVANALDDVELPGFQYELIYSGNPPKTEAEFLKFWGISNDPQYVFGMIENQSGVAVEKIRLVENRPGIKRNTCWITRDSAKIVNATDPLENLPNKAKYDAAELIATMPKSYAGDSGKLLVYFLSNAKGERQAKAPTNIVVDHNNVRGIEIRNSSSCIFCHVEGIRPPTENGFRTYVESGARIYTDYKNKEAIDLYHGSDVEKEIDRDNLDYNAALQPINGLTAGLNAKVFAMCTALYDADVTLETAGRMLHIRPDELQLALAAYSAKYKVSGRFVQLAQGKAISRDAFNANYYTIQAAAVTWGVAK